MMTDAEWAAYIAFREMSEPQEDIERLCAAWRRHEEGAGRADRVPDETLKELARVMRQTMRG